MMQVPAADITTREDQERAFWQAVESGSYWSEPEDDEIQEVS